MRLSAIFLIFFFLLPLFSFCQKPQRIYVCPPNAAHDKLSFDNDGECLVCGRKLIEKMNSSDINKIDLNTGSGNFLIDGGNRHKEKTITIFYHKPRNFSKQSPVLIVVPGSGRNGWDYRDAWIKASQKYGVLILSPHYSEKYYPNFWSYNLGRMISNVVINEDHTAMLNYEINQNAKDWIWHDFDRIFITVKNNLELSTETYDMFGHSAGGQILHRMTLFYTDNKANRILASNSGWYTIPSARDSVPYGLKGIDSNIIQLDKTYKATLTVFLGEEDNENETRGHLPRSPKLDKQGIHRFARGKYFFNEAKKHADSLDKEFNWTLKIIPNVGHNYKRMSEAAAEYLYKSKE